MKVLVVIDMQKDFTTGVLGNEQTAAVVAPVAEKIREFRKNPEDVIFATFDTHFENYMDTQEGKNLPVPHCIKGTDGWTLDNEVAEALGDEYTPIGKLTFGSVELPQRIKAAVNTDEIEEIQLIGVCTDICVISNAMILKAEFTEVPIRVFADCCAGVTPESHSNALNAMKMCQIIVEE